MDARRISRRNRFAAPRVFSGASELERRSIWRLRRAQGFILLSCLLTIGLAWYTLVSSAFSVRSIVVNGTVNDSVSKAIEELQGKNIVRLATHRLERELPTQQSSLESIHIVKGFPDTLRVNVSVRTPVVAWKSGESTNWIDERGIIFSLEQPPDQSSRLLPLVIDTLGQPVVVGKRFVTPTFLRFVQTLTTTFQDRIGTTISVLEINESTRNLDVVTDGNLRIRFDTTRGLDPQLLALAKILEAYRADIHEYVDLRVDGRVFYK